jgi:hypothetical protein
MTGSDSERLSLESHVVFAFECPAIALRDLVPFRATGVFVTYLVLFRDVTHFYCPVFSLISPPKYVQGLIKGSQETLAR